MDFNGKWNKLKDEVTKKWDKLTEDDINEINGQEEQLIKKIEGRYSKPREDAKREIEIWMRGFY